MVIADNETRWNSTYLLIRRRIKLYSKIQVFSNDHKDELEDDFLLPEDWDVLRRLEEYLQPFHRTTKELEGHAANSHYGAIWEALPAMQHLLRHLERLKIFIPKRDTRLLECVNNSWAKLNEYYQLTDKSHEIYAAATLLHPAMRIAHFKKNWTGNAADWIDVMEAKCQHIWSTEFQPFRPAEEQQQIVQEDSFLSDMLGSPESGSDEFHRYTHGDPTLVDSPKTFNPIAWWNDRKASFPTLHFYAFDTLSIPAMSAECERVFSSAKKLISSERNRLTEEIIEASECLKNWWDYGLITQQRNAN